jgi:hypothetical protein
VASSTVPKVPLIAANHPVTISVPDKKKKQKAKINLAITPSLVSMLVPHFFYFQLTKLQNLVLLLEKEHPAMYIF